MSRIIVNILPVLLPFLIYGLYLWHAKRTGQAHPERTPWFWLAVAGIILVILAFIVSGLVGESGPGNYSPAHLEGGRIVPGVIDSEKPK